MILCSFWRRQEAVEPFLVLWHPFALQSVLSLIWSFKPDVPGFGIHRFS